MYDVIIIGAGPAGLTAGIFAARRAMKTLILGDPASISQTEEATVVDDWPGTPNIAGTELIKRFREHVKRVGADLKYEKVLSLKKIDNGFSVKTDKNEYKSKTLIITTGARHRKAKIPGEAEFSGKGVSYCATCDAPLFKGKRVLVVGGGDSAVMYAVLLADIASETILIHRRDELRAAEALQKQIFKSKVKIMWNTIPKKINGDKLVKSIIVQNVKTKKETKIAIDGVFIAIGTVPTSELAKDLNVHVNEWGFIKVDRKQKTNMEGIYAAGDCCDNPTKKIATAAGDGAIAAESAYKYIKERQ